MLLAAIHHVLVTTTEPLCGLIVAHLSSGLNVETAVDGNLGSGTDGQVTEQKAQNKCRP